jgi:hypothetical protein
MRTGRWWIGRAAAPLLAGLALAACEETFVVAPDPGVPDAPRAFDASYFAGAVTLTWELGPLWSGEPFRVYGKRSTDADYFLIAEVTNCIDGFCSYTDVNVIGGLEYDYYIAAVALSGIETPTPRALRVTVPLPIAPPVPTDLLAVALDGAVYLRWADTPRDTPDFSFYRVYLELPEGPFLLGETDSPGFLDELTANGVTASYSVSSIDDQGHESPLSDIVSSTPRPDFEGELVYDFFSGRPDLAGFRFRESDAIDPIVSGADPLRHFRLETDEGGWWLVPGPGAAVYPDGFITTALRCGVAADPGCVELTEAPAGGYVAGAVGLLPSTTYVLRVPGDDGAVRFGAIRVELLGFDQNGDPLMVFDWAYQLQPGNPMLSRGGVRATP